MDLSDYILHSVKQNASDLHLSAGYFPMIRKEGQLIVLDRQQLDPNKFEKQLKYSLTTEQWQKLIQSGQIDYSFTHQQKFRLRGNVFKQHYGFSAAYRFIPENIPTLFELMLPNVFINQIKHRNGLLLVTGATGSGKSTTLAALVQHLNNEQQKHILTLEDPIEFIHSSKNCLIQQREIGTHMLSFRVGLRAALREDPDIILLGELRDPETIRLALTAAETGHLVLASLHTRSAMQSVERIVDVFPAEEKSFVRVQLASNLRVVLAQCLFAKTGGGRIAAYEVLLNTPAVANLIREGKTQHLFSVLQTGAGSGMQTMEQGIQQRVRAGILDLKCCSAELFKPAF